ncbi:MAG: riboflavin synthase [candidate division FCPU426 bacterium]
MFTGLIHCLGRVTSVVPGAEVLRVAIATRNLKPETIGVGDSVAVNGICLTLVGRSSHAFVAEASQETRRRTTLGMWKAGDEVNLEPALSVNGKLDGHWVAGHIDEIAVMRSLVSQGDGCIMEFTTQPRLMKFIAEKGSVALDGVSLTVSSLKKQDTFAVAVIPHTLRNTTLGKWKVGKKVNLEVDLLARYAERLLAVGRLDGGLTREKLAAAGFDETGEVEQTSW